MQPHSAPDIYLMKREKSRTGCMLVLIVDTPAGHRRRHLRRDLLAKPSEHGRCRTGGVPGRPRGGGYSPRGHGGCAASGSRVPIVPAPPAPPVPIVETPAPPPAPASDDTEANTGETAAVEPAVMPPRCCRPCPPPGCRRCGSPVCGCPGQAEGRRLPGRTPCRPGCPGCRPGRTGNRIPS